MARLVASLCLVPLLFMALAQCEESAAKAELSGFALANNYFGFNLLNLLAEENAAKPQSENIFFSPYSISVALGMLYQGSAGNTSNQLEATLGYQLARLDNDKSAVAQQIRDSDSAILVPENSNASYILKSGNALLQSKKFQALDAYKQSLVQNYRAELFTVNFATEAVQAQNLINNWVSNKTSGKIPQLLSAPPAPETLLALVNAVYFKGKWKNPFDAQLTKPDTFYGPKGANFSEVPFMNMNDRFSFKRVDDWNASLLELPYQGDDLSFYAILPYENQGDLKSLRKHLTPSNVDTAIKTIFRPRKVRIQFPKLDFKTTYDLVDTLKVAGITDVFDGRKADLSAISAEQNLHVDMVKHMATIEVNEEGAEAAGATYVGITKSGASRPQGPLLFNRPFVFFIRHKQNGQILFLGEVNQF